jgi:hypothetical protein
MCRTMWLALRYLVDRTCHVYGPIYKALGGVISGHTLKHLLACLGAYEILRMLQRRQPLNVEAGRVVAPSDQQTDPPESPERW